MNTKNNRQFRNTQKIIRQSLLELLENHNFRQLSVTDICKKAGINRSTFYVHYLDIYDLMEKTEDELNRKLLDLYKYSGADNYNFFSPKYIAIFLRYIRQYKNFYRDFIQNQKSFPILEGFQDLWYMMKLHYQSIGLKSEDEMMYHFVYFQAGFTMVLKRWLDSDCKETPEEMADTLVRCFKNSLL